MDQEDYIAEVRQLPQLSVILVRYGRFTPGAMSTSFSAGICMYWLELSTACERSRNSNHILSRRLHELSDALAGNSHLVQMISYMTSRLPSNGLAQGLFCVEG